MPQVYTAFLMEIIDFPSSVNLEQAQSNLTRAAVAYGAEPTSPLLRKRLDLAADAAVNAGVLPGKVVEIVSAVPGLFDRHTMSNVTSRPGKIIPIR